MSYEGVTKFGQPGKIISDIRSVPGENITQEQWDEIFGPKGNCKKISKTSYLNDKKIEKGTIYFPNGDILQFILETNYGETGKMTYSNFIFGDKKHENITV